MFLAGFLAHWLLHQAVYSNVLLVTTTTPFTDTRTATTHTGPVMPAFQRMQEESRPQHQHSIAIEPGIYPLLRDFQCGHENLETPRALTRRVDDDNNRRRRSASYKRIHGNGRFVVDIGLADGTETLDATEAGFVVFGFELQSQST